MVAERRRALSGVDQFLCGLVVVIEHGNSGAVGPGTDGSASTARRSSETGKRSPSSRIPDNRTSGSARDEQVSNFHGSRHGVEIRSFNFESVVAVANLEPVMESAFTGSVEKPIADLTPEMRLGAKQLYYLFMNTVRGKALTLVRCAEKHHGIEAWKRIKSVPV